MNDTPRNLQRSDFDSAAAEEATPEAPNAVEIPVHGGFPSHSRLAGRMTVLCYEAG